jgi:hypothetical protein
MMASWRLAASQLMVMRPPYLLSKRVNKTTAANVDPVQVIDRLYSNAILLHRMLSCSSKSIADRENV